MFAFNTHTLTRLAHMQGIHAWGLPLALLAADRLVTRTWLRDAVWLAVWMTAMAYTSGYLVVFGSVHGRRRGRGAGARLGGKPVKVLGTFAAGSRAGWHRRSLPVYLPYPRVARDQGMVRSLERVADFSASPKGYLAAAGRIHFSTWSGRFFPRSGRFLFPGLRGDRAGRVRDLAASLRRRCGDDGLDPTTR